MTPWKPLSWLFKDANTSAWIKDMWPNLLVHEEKVKAVPSARDPLGSQPRLEFRTWYESTTLEQVACVRVGDEWSAALEPGVLQSYMLIQWPDMFRRADDGKTM